MPTITQLLLTCGVLDASLRKCFKENLSSQEQIPKIKSNSFVNTLAHQTLKTWKTFPNKVRSLSKTYPRTRKTVKTFRRYSPSPMTSPSTCWKNCWSSTPTKESRSLRHYLTHIWLTYTYKKTSHHESPSIIWTSSSRTTTWQPSS